MQKGLLMLNRCKGRFRIRVCVKEGERVVVVGIVIILFTYS